MNRKVALMIIIVSVAALLFVFARAASAAPVFNIFRSLIPETNSAYYVGTTTPSTIAWKGLVVDQVCLTADSCRTTWPTGGAGASFAYPFSAFNGIGTTTALIFSASTTVGNGTVTGGLTVAGTATTTNLNITSVTGTQCLHAIGGVVSGTGSDCGVGSSSFAYPFPLNATSTMLTFSGGLLSTASSTFTGTLTIATGTIGSLNNVIMVDGVHYPQTGEGIQIAINSLPASGGKVFLPAGTYLVSTPITISSDNVSIEGAGYSTIIKAVASFNDYLIKVNDAALRSHLTFKDFKMDGDQADQTSGGCLMASSTAASVIDTVWFTGCKTISLKLAGTSGGTFGSANTVAHSVFDSVGTYGLWLNKNDEDSIHDNTFSDFSQYAIYDEAGTQNIHDNVFVGGSSWTVGGGIYTTTSNSRITQNNFDGVKGTAINLQGSYNTVTGNFMSYLAGSQGVSAIINNGLANVIESNTTNGGTHYPYPYQEQSSALSTSLMGNYFQTGTSSGPSLINSNTSNAFFNNFDTATNPPNAVYWGQVDSGGNFHFNAPSTQSHVFSINGATALTVNAFGSTVVNATSTNSYNSGKANFGNTAALLNDIVNIYGTGNQLGIYDSSGGSEWRLENSGGVFNFVQVGVRVPAFFDSAGVFKEAQGLLSTASTTIGAGNQGTGLTIFGGATTTLNAYFASNVGVGSTSPGTLLSLGNSATDFINLSHTATSTFGHGLNISSNDCFSVSGTCLQTIIQAATAFKQAAKYATTAALPSNNYLNGVAGVGATITEVGNGALSVDSASPSVGDRVLVKNEGTGANNGIYTVTATGSGIAVFVLTRATDYNSQADVYPGVANFVNSGTVNANTCWVVSNTTAITIGTTAITYDDACGSGSFSSTFPITVTGTTISFSGLATTSALVDGRVLYGSGVNGIANVATSTITFSGPFSGLGFGALVGGANTTVTWTGLSTTSAITTGQLLMATGVSGVSSVATGTISGTNGVTVTAARYAIGGATTVDCTAASISATGCLSAANFLIFNNKVATSAQETANNLPYWTTTLGSPPQLGSAAKLNWLNNANWLGVGTTTPQWLLTLATSTAPQLVITDNVANGWAFRDAGNSLYLSTTNLATFATSTNPMLTLFNNGHLGLGTTTPWGTLSIASTTYNYSDPLFVIATSTTLWGSLVTISATTTTLQSNQNPLGTVLDSGVRIAIGAMNYLGSVWSSLDQLFVNGRINTGDWRNVECSGISGPVSADANAACGPFGFQADTSGSLSVLASTVDGLIDNCISTSGASCNNPGSAVTGVGAGLFFPSVSTAAVFRMGTSTPVMEVVARNESPQNSTSTQIYIGFTNVNPLGTTFEVAPTAGCYFTASSSQANWFAVCSSTITAMTVVNTGFASTSNIAATGGFYRFRIEADQGGARFYMGSSTAALAQVANIATNIPTTVSLNAGVYIAASAAGLAKTLDINVIKLWFNQPALNYNN